MTTERGRRSRRQRMWDRTKYVSYLTGWTAVRKLPPRAAYRVFRAIADYAFWRRWKPIVRLDQNLRRVRRDADDAEIRALTREGMRSYMRYFCDAFRMEDWSTEEVMARTVVIGTDNIEGALALGKGAVVALPHTANWDWAGAWACQVLSPLATVAERLNPPELFDRFVRYRESLGMTVWPLTDSPVDPIQALSEHLRAGKLVCLPAERDLSQRGITVSFFGEKTRFPAGPAILHLRTGAPIVPVTLRYLGTEPNHELEIHFHPPLTADGIRAGRIQALTQQFAEIFEEGITAVPHDWHMTQRLFLADLDPDHPKASDAGS